MTDNRLQARGLSIGYDDTTIVKDLTVDVRDGQITSTEVPALLALGAVAAAGPTWQRDEPGYLDNVAPLVLAVDLRSNIVPVYDTTCLHAEAAVEWMLTQAEPERVAA